MNGLRLTFRKLWKNRLFSGLNILGLTIGISACWIIFNIVQYEYSFDRSHPDKDNIYQIVSKNFFEGKEGDFGGIQLALAPYIKENIKQAELVVPIYNRYYETVNLKSRNQELKTFDEPQEVKSTNSAYFDMVPYTWLAGDPKTALEHPNQVVLTRSRSAVYFSKLTAEEIVGQTIYYDEDAFKVSGIIADLEKPSSFMGQEFVSISAEDQNSDNWLSSNSNNILFVKLNSNYTTPFLTRINDKVAEMGKEFFTKYNYQTWYELLPLSKKHFSTQYSTGDHVASKQMLYGLIGIGTFLLLLACINYINLSTAQLPYRAKEIGVRKTLGEKGGRLTATFLRETLIICLLASIFAFPLVQLFQRLFADFMPPNIDHYSNLLAALAFLVGLVIFLTLIAGLYPAFLINRVNVVDVMKTQGTGKLSLGSLSLRKALIIFQFIIAQVFVIGSSIIASQMDFVMNTDLGFNKNAVITIPLPYKSNHNADTNPFLYKQALAAYPQIEHIALGHLPLSNNHWGDTFILKSDTGEVQLNLSVKHTDPDYFDVYDIQLLAGNRPTLADTANSIFFNETACRQLGIKNYAEAIGREIENSEENKTTIIRGIIKDFHHKNMHVNVEPMGVQITTKRNYLQTWNIKLTKDAEEWPKTIENLKKEWTKLYPNAPFEYKFYDQQLASLYESDRRQARMINLATSITIIISCLGLFGLVTLSAYQRTKEIGIRKVLGSSIVAIMTLLSKEYIKLILVAVIIACPIAWWAMDKWLQDFAYRIDIPWWLLMATSVATLVIALLSVSYQAFKAARANPVDSLRDE